jgi:hypothetical protein
LFELTPESKRTESCSKNRDYADSEFNAIEEPNAEVWERWVISQTVRAQEEDEVSGRDVHIYVLEAQKHRESKTT